MGYWVAPDRAAFLDSRSWAYQVVWLPAHLLCAYFAVCIYRGARQSCDPDSSLQPPGLLPYAVYVLKHFIMASVAVTPFLVMDGLEGYDMVLEEFASMGRSGWLLMAIWGIEWVATGVLWIHVLLTLRLTVQFYSEEYVRGHLDTLLITSKNSPLLMAGVENSLVILVYAAATFGYILWVGGEVSDFVALGVSAIFVLISFLGSMLHLKLRINRALDERCERSLQAFLSAPQSDTPTPTSPSLTDLQAMEALVFTRPPGITPKSYARLRLMKAQLLLQAGTSTDSRELARELLKFTEYELRLSTIGVAELRAVLVRLAAPAAGVMAKSGLLGGS